jgi:aspartate aminotransferase/aminotransferase
VTIGGTNAVAAALISILEAGDEVLSPDPAWPNYRLELSYSPAKMVTYPLHPAREFYPDPEELERLMTPRTKLLIINSPCNPTGAVFPKRVMEEIVRLCQKHDLYLISDECYDELIFEGEHVSPASLCDDGRVISVFTFSKTYAMTGYRVGYVVTNRQLADVINKMLEATMTCATSFAQKAAEAALKGPKDAVVKMVEAYKRRRDAVDILLRDHEMWVTKPHGAFYVMADISRSGMDSRSFAFRLLEEAKVAVAPGTAFGKTVPNLVRLSLASEDSDLREGIERMSDFVRTVAVKR